MGCGGQEEGAHGEGGDSSPQKRKRQLSTHETDALDTRAEVTARFVVVGGGWGLGEFIISFAYCSRRGGAKRRRREIK